MPGGRLPEFLDDQVFYADMIDSLASGRATILSSGPMGVLLLTENGTHMVAALNPSAAEELVETMAAGWSASPLVVAHDEFSATILGELYGFDRVTPCWSSALVGQAPAPIERADLHIETLGQEWSSTIAELYWMDDLAYVCERIDARVMLGAFRGDTLLGFVGRHQEGAIGMLEVLPEHRRQGVAEYLMTHLIDQIINEGRTPYDHIIVGNQASVALQLKLGFTISQRVLRWMSELSPLAPRETDDRDSDGTPGDHFTDLLR